MDSNVWNWYLLTQSLLNKDNCQACTPNPKSLAFKFKDRDFGHITVLLKRSWTREKCVLHKLKKTEVILAAKLFFLRLKCIHGKAAERYDK